MSTRATITVLDKDKESLINIFLRYDGYPDGTLMEALLILKDRLFIPESTTSIPATLEDTEIIWGEHAFASVLITTLNACIVHLYNLMDQEDSLSFKTFKTSNPFLFEVPSNKIYVCRPDEFWGGDYEYKLWFDQCSAPLKDVISIQVNDEILSFDEYLSKYDPDQKQRKLIAKMLKEERHD